MLSEQQAQELFSFFEKYIAAMHAIAQDEKEKLNALLSNSLPRIEHAISIAQANAKQVENFETKRILLQASMGCADMSLSQLIEEIPEPQKKAMSSLFNQLGKYVDEIKFANDKSIDIAKANITRMNPDKAAQTQGDVTYSPNTPYETAMGIKPQNRSIFKTTV